ncbi:hypothetical protein VTO42DRAFT_4364 [Malbranchea cinnamomea]
MPRPKRKTKEEELARVRNNQRRSRERRRQYIAELERRIQHYEAVQTQALAPTSASASTSVQNLMRENGALRELLGFIGFDQSFLDQYLRGGTGPNNCENNNNVLREPGEAALAADSTVPSSSHAQVVESSPTLTPLLMTPAMISDYDFHQTGTVQTTTAEPTSNLATAELLGPLGDGIPLSPRRSNLAVEMAPNDSSSSTSVPKLPSFGSGFTITEDLAAIIDSLDGEKTRGRSSAVDEQTTLCSVAFRLIVQCNHKGMDVLELETKLRYGYRMPANPGDPCRVDNKTLLAVLAELI